MIEGIIHVRWKNYESALLYPLTRCGMTYARRAREVTTTPWRPRGKPTSKDATCMTCIARHTEG